MKKRLAVLLAALPLLAVAEEAKPPSSTVVIVDRVWIKQGHKDAFNVALAAHARQFHAGDPQWQVYEVLTGPESGAIQFLEGPRTWTAWEESKAPGEQHNRDYETNIAPHIEKAGVHAFAELRPEFSVQLSGTFSNKYVLSHVYPKIGRGGGVNEDLKILKAVWEKLGYNVSVWNVRASGETQITIASRMKNGYKDFEPDGNAVLTAYETMFGAGSWAKRNEQLSRNVERYWTEIIMLRPESPAK